MERENIMGTMEINPLLVKLSVPMMISMLVQALYNVVDSVFVSWVSEEALTAVSLAFSLQNMMIAVGVGTGVGVNAMLSKSLGEKNQKRANATAENGIFLSVCSFLVFLVIGLTCIKPYFYAQTSDDAIALQGIRYLSVCCIFSLGLFTQTMGEKLLAATGRTQLSMISQLVGAVVNIILDPIFIFGYCGEALSGTTGAAVATVIGQFCGAGMTLYFNTRKNPDIQLDFKGFRPSAKAIGRIYTVGLPSIAMQCVGSLMTFGMNLILMAFSSTAVAVFGVYFKLQSFVFKMCIRDRYCVVVTLQIFLVYFCFNMLYHGTNVGVPLWVATVLNLLIFQMLFAYMWPQIALLDQPLSLTMKNSINCMIAFLPLSLIHICSGGGAGWTGCPGPR